MLINLQNYSHDLHNEAHNQNYAFSNLGSTLAGFLAQSFLNTWRLSVI